MKIPFDIKHKDDILANLVRVETRGGESVEIISFSGREPWEIVGYIGDSALTEDWTIEGWANDILGEDYDLVIIKPE